VQRLKYWSLYLLLAITTFAAGYQMVWRIGPVSPVSLCEIAAAPERYAGRKVRVRVWLQRIQGSATLEEMPAGWVIATSQCSAESLEGATIIFSDVSDIEKLPITVSERGREHPTVLTEAIISGYLKEDYEGLHCFAPKYTLERVRWEKLIASRTFDNDEEASEWFRRLH
jgi:hypothetical protein